MRGEAVNETPKKEIIMTSHMTLSAVPNSVIDIVVNMQDVYQNTNPKIDSNLIQARVTRIR